MVQWKPSYWWQFACQPESFSLQLCIHIALLVFYDATVFCAMQIWTPYIHYFGVAQLGMLPSTQKRLDYLQFPAVPFHQKLNAIFWASSNCGSTRNNRVAVVARLQKALANSSLELHSYGRCLRNMNEFMVARTMGQNGAMNRIVASSKYKFCIVSKP